MSTETLGTGNGLGPPNSRMPGGRAPSRHCQGICGQQTQHSPQMRRGACSILATHQVWVVSMSRLPHMETGAAGGSASLGRRDRGSAFSRPSSASSANHQMRHLGRPHCPGWGTREGSPGQTGPGTPRSLPATSRTTVHRVWVREEEAGIPGQSVSAGRTRLGEHNSALA